MEQTALVQNFDQYTGTDSQGSAVHSLGRIEEPVRVSHTILRIVSLLLLIAVLGGGFVWWQDQTSLRPKELVGLNQEHVEVEGADGTTQIHPIDEPEDQAVIDGQIDGQTSLALPGQAPAEAQANSVETGVQTPAVVPVAAAPVVAAPAVPVTAAPAAAAVLPTPVAHAAPVTPAPIAGNGQVRLQFVADCWAQVSDASGKVLLSGLKRKGENVEVSGKPPFSVRLGYARGAQISYNGQAVDIGPFTSGETARLKLGQ
jgi:cytoskeleton protein RodZ